MTIAQKTATGYPDDYTTAQFDITPSAASPPEATAARIPRAARLVNAAWQSAQGRP